MQVRYTGSAKTGELEARLNWFLGSEEHTCCEQNNSYIFTGQKSGFTFSLPTIVWAVINREESK